MNAKEVKYFYVTASQTYNRREPNEAECTSWIRVLEGFKYPDLDAAWRRWQSDSEIEQFTQRPRGSRMPTAAELKASIESFRSRMAEKNKFRPCNNCNSGWVVGEDRRARRCQCFIDFLHEYKQTA